MNPSSVEKAIRMNPVEGVDVRIIGNTSKVMLTYIIAKPGAVVPGHTHPHDQIGTCVQGSGELVSGGRKLKTVPGASWTIPGGEHHEWRSTSKEDTILIECFSPPREDYLAKAK